MMPNTQQIQAAARKWIDANATRVTQRKNDAVTKALAVIVLTWNTVDYLAENDPQALKQAQLALTGKSWEYYLDELPACHPAIVEFVQGT